jgi:SAM-dependent methyltransferase
VKRATLKKVKPAPAPLKLDLGCGKNKREGFHGVDSRPFDGVDTVVDLVARAKGFNVVNTEHGGKEAMPKFRPWPWKEASVEEAHSSHFVEHLHADERIHFVNELYRILKPGGKAQIIVPHWSSCRAYGDLTHQWPPVSEFWFYYLSKSWREVNAPHNDAYICDFEATWGYSLHQGIVSRNPEYQQHALQFFKEAAQDIIATLTKR